MSHGRLIAAHGKAAAAWFPDCSICLAEPRTTRFDCGHLCTCDTCAEALEVSNGGCPICRQPIGRWLYSEVPPVPGRQPTYETVEVALQRLVETLDSADSKAQEEAAFALCLRAQEAGNGNLEAFSQLVDAGVIEPLVGLLAESTADAAKACASVTLGLVARIACHQILACGGVPALLRALRRPPVAEYAALALSSLAEQDAPATAAAITSTADGYAPLVALLAHDVDAATCEAACGALANLCQVAGAHGAATAARPALPLLAELMAHSDDEGLKLAAAALHANVEMIPRDQHMDQQERGSAASAPGDFAALQERSSAPGAPASPAALPETSMASEVAPTGTSPPPEPPRVATVEESAPSAPEQNEPNNQRQLAAARGRRTSRSSTTKKCVLM